MARDRKKESYTHVVILLLMKCVRPILRALVLNLVRNESPPGENAWSIDEFLARHKRRIEKELPVIDKYDVYRNILYPANTQTLTTDINTWDLTLYVFILTKVCKIDQELAYYVGQITGIRADFCKARFSGITRSMCKDYRKRLSRVRSRLYKQLRDDDLRKQIEKRAKKIEKRNTDPSKKKDILKQWKDIEVAQCLNAAAKKTGDQKYHTIKKLLSESCVEVMQALVFKSVRDNCHGRATERSLDNFLCRHKSRIDRRIWSLDKLGRPIDILFPKGKTTQIDKWDISLLCWVLLNLCFLKDDTADSIGEIRTIRNEIAHDDSYSLSDLEYNSYLERIKRAISTCLFFLNDEEISESINDNVEDIEQSSIDKDETIRNLKISCQKNDTSQREQQEKLLEGQQSILSELSQIVRIFKDIEIPVCQLELVISNCNHENENTMSKAIVEEINDFLKGEQGHSSLRRSQKFRAAVKTMIRETKAKGWAFTNATKGSVLLNVQCGSFDDLCQLYSTYMNNGSDLHVVDLRSALQCIMGIDVKLHLVMYDIEMDKCVEKIVSAVMEATQTMASIKADEMDMEYDRFSSSPDASCLERERCISLDNRVLKIREALSSQYHMSDLTPFTVSGEWNQNTVDEIDMVVKDKAEREQQLSSEDDTDKRSPCLGMECTVSDIYAMDTEYQEKRLKIVEDLHVATDAADVRENCDIVLICSVNCHMPKVMWRHNGHEIKQCNKHVASVHELEHKLTIRNAKVEDEGEYRVDFGDVATSTGLTIQGNINLLHKMQVEKNLFENWIRGALCLRYTNLALEDFVDISAKEVPKHTSAIGQLCAICTKEVLLPSNKKEQCPQRKTCLCSKQQDMRTPNEEFCGKCYDQVLFDHRFNDLVLANTDVRSWSRVPWNVAACFINTTGYQGKSSAKEVDCSGLLSLIIINLGDVEINSEIDLYKQAKDARNDILHSGNYELSESQLNDYIELSTSVLEIKYFSGNAPIAKLNELREKQIDMHIPNDFQKQMKDLQEDDMHELARLIEKANKQNAIRIQQLEKRLQDTERDLQLMRDLRSSQIKYKEVEKVPFELELRIEVIGKTGETSIEGNQRVYQTMLDYTYSQTTKRDISSTEQTIHRILGYITNIRTCQLVDVLNIRSSVSLRFHCFTCKAVEEFVKLINGNKFQNEIFVLRRCLEAHDITAFCSSQSIEHTKKRLGNRIKTNDFACGKHQDTQCTWYCSDHDKFCCSACKDLDHRACVGLKQVVSDRSYGKQKQSLVLKSKRGEYTVKIKNRLINRDDNDKDDCYIGSICVLPDGNILVLDHNNKRLKELDSSYNLISYCDLLHRPGDVCYIGNDIAVISLGDAIQYVNVSGNLKHLKEVKLNHHCYGLAGHGETLYVTDWVTVYTYDKDCQQRRVLYRLHNVKKMYHRIAVSDDGEKIYILDIECGLITLDNKGNHLFTLKNVILNYPRDIRVVDNGSVLVLDNSGCVLQVDYRGEQVLGTVVSTSYGLLGAQSLCYDRKRCRIIVGYPGKNYLSVYDLQHSREVI